MGKLRPRARPRAHRLLARVTPPPLGTYVISGTCPRAPILGPSGSQRGGRQARRVAPLSSRSASLCLAASPRACSAVPARPSGTFLRRPELPAAAGWPQAQGMSLAACRGLSHVVSPLPQVGAPGELDALYFEQNKAQEETESDSRTGLQILS